MKNIIILIALLQSGSIFGQRLSDLTLKVSVSGTEKIPVSGSGTPGPAINGQLLRQYIVHDSINNGVTSIAPSQNAVYDALALKQNALGFNPSRRLLYIKNLPDAVTGTTSETITDSFQIPAGTLQANDILNIMVTSTKSGTNAAATIRVKANTTAVLAGATTIATSTYPTASTLWNKFQREVIFRNSLSSQFAWSTTTSMANEITTNTTANTNLTIDFSTTQYIIVSIQPAGTLDTTKIESWYVEVIRN